MEKIKVCQLSDAHTIYDDRIYWKYCLSLKKNGYDVVFIGLANKNCYFVSKEGIELFGLVRKNYVKVRFLNKILKILLKKDVYHEIYKIARKLNADIYHFHNINLNLIGKKLKNLPQHPVVVYDVREPYPQHIRDYYKTGGISTVIKNIIADYVEKWELRHARNYDFIISNEENVANHFRKSINSDKIDVIYNYTNLNPEFKRLPFNEKIYDAIYCGVITRHRGAIQILNAARIAREIKNDIKILMLGAIHDNRLKSEMHDFIEKHDLKNNVILKGFVPYHEVHDYYLRSKVALGIFLPIKTHEIILQIKIFEYLAYGLPIVSSNFGHISNFVDKYQAGITIDPLMPDSICNAIIKLIDDIPLYWSLSDNGITAAQKYFTWDKMETKLLKIYKLLLRSNRQLNNQ